MKIALPLALAGLGLSLVVAPTAQAADPLPIGVNLLTNPGFETGPSTGFAEAPGTIPGWTVETPRARVVGYADPARPATYYDPATVAAAGGGCRGLVGPPSPSDTDDIPMDDGQAFYSVSQRVALPASAAGQTYELSALLGRVGTTEAPSYDVGSVEIRFYDGAGTEIAGTDQSIDNYSTTPAQTQDLSTQLATDPIPPDTAAAVVTASSNPQFAVQHSGTAAGLVDNVGFSYGVDAPPAQATGCGTAAPTTGTATPSSAGTSATLTGTVDTRHERVRTSYRFGVGALSAQTPAVELTPGDTPVAFTQTVEGLAPGSTYSYALVTQTVLNGIAGPAVQGATRTFTPVPPNPSYASVVSVRKPKGGCVRPGGKVRVSAVDAALGTRLLSAFTVTAKGKGKPRTTSGPVGRSAGTVKAKKLPQAPRGKRPKLKLSVGVTYADLPGAPGTGFSVQGTRRLPYC